MVQLNYSQIYIFPVFLFYSIISEFLKDIHKVVHSYSQLFHQFDEDILLWTFLNFGDSF